MAPVSLRQIGKSYDGAAVIEALDLDIRDGEFLVLVGPSGCGKSTLLRMVAGLGPISAGDLLIGDSRALREATGWQPSLTFEQLVRQLAEEPPDAW